MPSTEHGIFSPVDGCFNHIDGKPCFRYVPHKMIKIRVRIEIRVFQIVYLPSYETIGCIIKNHIILIRFSIRIHWCFKGNMHA